MNEKFYKIEKRRASQFFQRLQDDFFTEVKCFDAEYFRSKEPVLFREREMHAYTPIKEGGKWGEILDSAWFRLKGEIPASWKGREVAAKLNLGGEVMIFDSTGCPIYGLTNTSSFAIHYRKELFFMDSKAKPGKFTIWAEAAANGLFGNYEHALHKDMFGIAPHLKYGLFNRDVWALRLDMEILLGLIQPYIGTAQVHPEGGRRANQILKALNEAVDVYGDDPGNASAARKCLVRELSYKAEESAMKVTAVGHAHIDTAWLWRVRETIRKCARTFSSQLKLMEKYPDYVFGASQAQLYAFVKEHYPVLYKKIKERVKEGRWEIQGGMWVEADCNIISGESMVRQFIHGKNFFMDEFGFDVKNLWLPDVFGYSAAMPQIIRKSGCDHFMTQKISWSEINKFPYHAFTWKGIDGTGVLSFFPPEDTYNGSMIAESLHYASENFKENHIADEILSVYGIGDGGGGPKEEYLERALRMKNLEGVPKVSFGRADDFFKRLENFREQLPEWVGELYLETHRGTLTTQGKTKRNNRMCEQRLTETEFILSSLPLKEYPSAKMDAMWKKLLLNQFHDIIPGSSIREVYEDTEREHAEILRDCAELQAEAAKKFFRKKSDSAVVVNSLSYNYTLPIELPAEMAGFELISNSGEELKTQMCGDRMYAIGKFAPQSFTTIRKGRKKAVPQTLKSNSLVLENDLVRYDFAADGRILKFHDKAENMIFASENGIGNMLRLMVDIPNGEEAWNLEHFHTNGKHETPESVKKAVNMSGPIQSHIEFTLKIGKSEISQKAILPADSKMLVFETVIEWREKRRILRVGFNTPASSTEAAFDIQYAFIKRPTYKNTSWDHARFEVAGQRYADISDHSYGVALINDCKYGHAVKENMIDLALLRSTSDPDHSADIGSHLIRYAYLLHKGTLVESDVMACAAMLNRPAGVFGRFESDADSMFCHIAESDGVTLEVMKKGEKENCRIIRLVECNGKSSKAVLEFAGKVSAAETNLTEWENGREMKLPDGKLQVTLNPFEIRTYKIKNA